MTRSVSRRDRKQILQGKYFLSVFGMIDAYLPSRRPVVRLHAGSREPAVSQEPIMHPKAKLEIIQKQIEAEMAQRKEKDHHWEDAIDVSLKSQYFGSISTDLTIRMRTKPPLLPIHLVFSSLSSLLVPPLHRLLISPITPLPHDHVPLD